MTFSREFYLDRIEGDKAVLVSGETSINIPLSLLPPKAREGDHMTITLAVDESRRQAVKEEVADLQRRLSADEDGNG